MNRVPIRTLSAKLCLACAMTLGGCSPSEETIKEQTPQQPLQQSATEIMTNTMNNLKIQNDSLKLRIATLEQANRSSVARAAELETQLYDLKSKPSMTPLPTVKSTITDSEDAYEDALQKFRSRNYQGSATTFQRILDNNRFPDLSDNCHYWLGECAYALKHYQEAIGHFQKVFDFKVSEKKDDAQIMIAHCYYALGDRSNAKKEYSRFLEKFPASPYAKRAKERLTKL